MILSLRLAAGLATAAVAGAACGGSSSSGAPISPTIETRAGTTSATPASACPASAGLDSSLKDHGAAPAPGQAVALEAGDSFFAPTCTTNVPAGMATLALKNAGSALHNISFPDQGIDVDVPAGKSITVEVKMGASTIPFFCKYHRTSGMQGALLPPQS